MLKKDAKNRILFLQKELKKYAELYYTHDSPAVSDEVYDSLYQELVSLEQAFPDLKTTSSLTDKVGSVVLSHFEKVSHKYAQWSFDNVFDYESLVSWDSKIQKILYKESQAFDSLWYIMELKIDGLKVILDYENGKLIRAATRGDGLVGEDVTEHMKMLNDVPNEISEKRSLSVVGEVWMEESEFQRINKLRADEAEVLYANARNLAAGTLRQLDTSVLKERKLKMFCYDFDSTEILFETHSEELNFLLKNKFSVNPYRFESDSLSHIQKEYELWIEKRRKQEFAVDGMVLKLNENRLSEILGYTAKAPRFAFAYKFPAEQKTSVVIDISLQIGRTGVLTPVAEIEAVVIDGSSVSRASLHNQDEIDRLDIRIGDTVVVEKAGDIIPKIKSVILGLRKEESKKFMISEKAELLGFDVRENLSSAGVSSWYVDSENNEEVEIMKFSYFCSKKAVNIEGMGEKNVRALYLAAYIKKFSDIYALTYDQVIALPLFKEKATNNLLESIEKSRNISESSFITALGISHVGEEVSDLLVNSFNIIDLPDLTLQDIISLHGVGEKIAESLLSWFSISENRDEFRRLLDIFKFKQKDKSIEILLEKTFVVTGTLVDFSRDEIKSLIKKNGGKVSSSLSRKTDYLIAGEKAGSKLQKARDLSVDVIDEKDFIEMIKKKD